MNIKRTRLISYLTASAMLITSAIVCKYVPLNEEPQIDVTLADTAVIESVSAYNVPVAGICGAITDSMNDASVIEVMTLMDGLESNEAVLEALDAIRVAGPEDGWDIYITSVREYEDVVSEAEEAEDYSNLCVAQVDSYVNVRSMPSTDGEILGKLYNKSVGTVIEEAEDGWYHITSGNVDGYVCAEYVVVGDEELVKSVSRRVARVTCETLRVRKEPNTDSSIIELVPEGDDLTVTDETLEGWYGVTADSGDGFVSADYVTIATEFVTAESREEERARLEKEERARKAAAKAAGGSSPKLSGVTVPGSGAGVNVANYGLQFVGNPYVYGGSSLTGGTDCSGFVMSVYAAFGVGLPHSSSALRSCGYAVSADAVSPGDIICYSGHVAIYIGNGQIVHASNARTGIIVSPMNYKSILAIRRIF